MLTALKVKTVLAIAEASAAKRADEDAMIEYLNVGERALGGGRTMSGVEIGEAAKAGAFDSAERQHLLKLIEQLSAEARHELTALVWLGRGTETAEEFQFMVDHARKISTADDAHYLAGKPLHRYLPAGLRKLGLV